MRGVALTLPLALLGCGPAWAPADAPSRPCERIDRAGFEAAVSAGATRATADIGDGGVFSVTTGPGVVHCATAQGSTLKPCRRPNDFVIEVRQANQEPQFVRVPKNTEYRFRAGRGADICEIVLPPQLPQ